MILNIRPIMLLLASVFLISCASKPVVVDNSPLLRTAQVTSQVNSTGIKGLFGFQADTTSVTFQNARRVDHKMKFTGSIMSRVGGKQDTSDIIRLDKAVEWEVDNKRKRYQECPIGGCEGVGSYPGAVMDSETEDDFEEDPSCVMTVKEQSFDVKKTGQQRSINGFSATEYLIDWRAIAVDQEGGQAENLIEINIWTTPETAVISEALKMQTQFDKNYLKAIDNDFPASLDKAIPREAMALLIRFFLESMDKSDVEKLKIAMQKTSRIEGFPISRKIKWDAKNASCSTPPEPEEEEKGRLNTNSLKGLVASVGKELVNQEIDKKKAEKARELELTPILLFVDDVTSIQMIDTRESKLTVPSNYKLITRR